MSESPRPQQERDALPTRYIVGVGIVCVLIGALAVLVSGLPARMTSRRAARLEVPKTQETQLFDSDPRGLEVQAAQRTQLTKYGWVDRDAGVAQIPIDRAIDIVVEESR